MRVRSTKRRPTPDAKKIAARVEQFRACDECAPAPEVRPLNRGFFELERMRARQVQVKRAAAVKRQPRT